MRPETTDLDAVDFMGSEDAYARGRYFHADCPATDAIGDFVRISADDVADIFQVSKVDITDASTMPAIGLIISKSSATRCFVLTFGVYETTGLVPGQRYWVGFDGQLTGSLPIPPSPGTAVAQAIGYALSDTELLIRPDMMAIKLRR